MGTTQETNGLLPQLPGMLKGWLETLRPSWLHADNVERFFTGGPEESPLRNGAQQLISGNQDTLLDIADTIVTVDESLDTAINTVIRLYQNTGMDENVDTFVAFLDTSLQERFGEEWDALRNEMLKNYHIGELYFKATTGMHSYFNHGNLEANWMPLYFDWLLELKRPELGAWDKDPKTGFDRVTITNPDFIRDLIGHPGHQEMLEKLRESYPDIQTLRKSFEETTQHVPFVVNEYYAPGQAPFDGKYARDGEAPYRINAINGFIGSFRETAGHFTVNEQDHTITFDFEWWNKSGTRSMTRKSKDEMQKARQEGREISQERVPDYHRGLYGLGGAFVQQFEGSIRFPYDPATGDIDYHNGQLVLENTAIEKPYDSSLQADITHAMKDVTTPIAPATGEETGQSFTERAEKTQEKADAVKGM